MLIVPKVCSSNDQKQLWQLFIQRVDLKRFASRDIIHTSNLNKLSKLFIKLWSGNQENIISATFKVVIRKSSNKFMKLTSVYSFQHLCKIHANIMQYPFHQHYCSKDWDAKYNISPLFNLNFFDWKKKNFTMYFPFW